MFKHLRARLKISVLISYIDPFPNKNVRREKKFFRVWLFITLNLKRKIFLLPKKLNLPVAKLAQHPVKNGERYGASCKLAPAKKRYGPVANGR